MRVCVRVCTLGYTSAPTCECDVWPEVNTDLAVFLEYFPPWFPEPGLSPNPKSAGLARLLLVIPRKLVSVHTQLLFYMSTKDTKPGPDAWGESTLPIKISPSFLPVCLLNRYRTMHT